MRPKISIIVPVYNSEKYLEKCIESIINQTLKDIEIILINDGSTDNSKEILQNYSKRDCRIKVFNRNNSGPAATRNYGIKIATGKYIGFVDSDDYIEPQMYEKLIRVSEEKNVQMAMCNYLNLYTKNNKKEVVKHFLECNKIHNKEYIKKEIIKKFTGIINYGFFSMCNKIYLREWILGLGFLLDENREHGEDWWFNINAFMKLESFICIEDSLYNYIHINNESLMARYREEQFDLFLDGRLKVISVIPKELIDFDSLNKNFVYEFSAYILKTNKEIKDKKRRKVLLKKVVENSEVINCCKMAKGLPIYYKITTKLISNKLYNLALFTYKIIGLAL